MASKFTVRVRMGAPHWDVTVNHNGTPLHFDLRTMQRDERSAFHREFMNSFRAMRRAA